MNWREVGHDGRLSRQPVTMTAESAEIQAWNLIKAATLEEKIGASKMRQ